jgi:predicted regulator of Ras-like GTPase activity (Roadblock/LC7/MglB family)
MEQVKAVLERTPSFMNDFVPPRPPASRAGWTAPTGSAPLPSPPIDLPEPITDPAVALDDLTISNTEVTGAILGTVDGFTIARSTSMADEPSHAAMLAAAVGIAHPLVAMGGGKLLRRLVIEHDAGLMIVWPLGADRVLAVLASGRVDQRALQGAVQRHARLLSGAMS